MHLNGYYSELFSALACVIVNEHFQTTGKMSTVSWKSQ